MLVALVEKVLPETMLNVPPAPIVPPAIEIFEPVYKVLNVAVPVPDIVILPVMERLPPAEAVPTETVEL